MNDTDKTTTFGDLDDGDKFRSGGLLYEKESVPDAIRGIVENAICLDDMTAAMFEQSDEVMKTE